MPVTDDIPVAGTVEKQRGYGMQAIEPAAGLVNSFADEIGRKTPVFE